MITGRGSGSRPGDYPGGGMPQDRAVLVVLSAGERRTLKKRARGTKTAYRDWLRAQIVLAAARGRASARIAADLHVSVDTVRKWRGPVGAPRPAPAEGAPPPRPPPPDHAPGRGAAGGPALPPPA